MQSLLCAACGSSLFHTTPSPMQGVQIARCLQCGTGTTFPAPSREVLDAQYTEAYYGPGNKKFGSLIEAALHWNARRRARWIHRVLKPGSRILEIGCGRGTLLQSLADLGHECHGIERSALAAQRACRIQDITVYTVPLEQCGFANGYFDCVIMWHVLEHLEQPDLMVQVCAPFLGPEGKMIVEVPNIESWQARLSGSRWLHIDIERHLFHFTKAGLRALFERGGFHVRRFGYASIEMGPYGALQSFMNIIGMQQDELFKVLKREMRAPFARKISFFVLALVLAVPATALSLVETLCGRGSVIHAVAEKKRD